MKLRLPDGSIREVTAGTTARQVAEGIGKRLAQAAVAAEFVNSAPAQHSPCSPVRQEGSKRNS